MNVLEALHFVKGAIGKRDRVSEQTFVRIMDGRITSYNGFVSLSAPASLGLDCCPKAEPFIRAIEACADTVQLHVTPAGKLSIRSGDFRTHIDTIPSAFVGIDPEGAPCTFGGPLLPVFAMLNQLTSEDASKPWAGGVVLDGGYAYATNNVVLAQYWLGFHFPYRVNIPRYAIREILKIGEEPTGGAFSANNATLYFSGDRWLRTQLVKQEWPDADDLFAMMPPTNSTLPATFFDALERLAPFVQKDRRVYLFPSAIATHRDGTGTTIEVPGLTGAGVYVIDALLSLRGRALRLGCEEFPRPVPFYGDRMRGVVMGIRE